MMVISIVVLVGLFLFSGMMIDYSTMNPVFQAFSSVSLFKHAFDAGIISVWRGVNLRCEENEVCMYENGDAVLRSYNINPAEVDAHFQKSLVMMAVLSVCARIFGFARIYTRYVFDDNWRLVCGSTSESAKTSEEQHASAQKSENEKAFGCEDDKTSNGDMNSKV